MFLFCLGLVPQPIWAAPRDYDTEITKQKSELDEVRRRMEGERRELARLVEEKTGVLERLGLLSRSIATAEEYMRGLESTEASLVTAIERTRSDISALEKRIGDRNVLMAARVRALHRAGGPDNLLMRAWGASQGDFFRRVFYVRRVLAYDRSLVQAGRTDAAQKSAALRKLDARIAELAQFRARKAREREELSVELGDREAAYRKLQENVEAKNRAIDEMERNAKLLNGIIAALEKKRREDAARGRRRRDLETSERYCLPVDGDIVSHYGMQYHATLKTSTKNLGIEIKGSPGSPVRAAVSGEVALVTRIPGYGMGIILDNGSGYFTIYANLEGIKVGQGDKVSTCQELASLPLDRSFSDRVYFEVRQGTKTLDPAKWLKQ